MLDKNILFIGNAGNFISNSIVKGLEEKNFNVICTNYNSKDIEDNSSIVGTFLLHIEDENDVLTLNVIKTLKELCGILENKKVILAGSDIGILKATQTIGKEYIWTSFKRPINPKNLADTLLNLYERGEITDDKKEILVVDDSGTFLLNIKKVLEPAYKITMVNSAINGMSYLGKHIPDLILLDYEMPVCSGPQMLEMIRADEVFSKIPVIFLTGKGDRESISKVLDLKPQGYLLKSLPNDSIRERIDAFFSK